MLHNSFWHARRRFLKFNLVLVGGIPFPRVFLRRYLTSTPIVVDDSGGDGKFIQFGPPYYWWPRSDTSFQLGTMVYTYNTNYPPNTYTNGATWESPPLSAGEYEVFVYIPLQNAETQLATYHVEDTNGKTEVPVSQIGARGQWVSLGLFTYEDQQKGFVTLYDIVPEQQPSTYVKIAFDAVAWIPSGGTWNPEQDLLPYFPYWATFGYQPWTGWAGDPVSTGLGSFTYQHTDFSVPGRRLDVEFIRTYNSLDPRPGSFGIGFRCTYDIEAVDRGNGDIIVTFADGRSGLYEANESGGYDRPAGFFADLEMQDGQLVLTEKNQTEYRFRSNGKLESITDPYGNRILFEYDDEGFTLTDTVDRQFRFTLNSDELITQIEGPSGRVYSYEYDGFALQKFTNADGSIIQYGFDEAMQLQTVTDPNGHVFVSNTYDDEGRIVEQADAKGFITTFEYSDSQTIVTDAEGNSTVHIHDDRFRLIEEVDALNHSLIFEYDDDNNRTAEIDRNGTRSANTYDENGNLLTHTDGKGNTESYTYNAQNSILSFVDKTGAQTRYVYDSAGINPTQITNAENGVKRFTYSSYGQVVAYTDENGHQTNYSYDSLGNVQSIENAEGEIVRFEHDSLGRRTGTIDGRGNGFAIHYDNVDRVVAFIDSKGNVIQYSYDRLGNLTSVEDRRGNTSRFVYDEADNLIERFNRRGYSSTFSYNRVHKLVSETNERGNTTLYSYDAVYNLQIVEDAKQHETRFIWDANRNLIEVHDSMDGITRYDYDEINLVYQITDALNGITSLSYDAVGRLTQWQAPNSGQFQLDRDQLGRVVRYVDAESNETQFIWDPVGNLTRRINGRGYPTEFDYDRVNRRVRQISPMQHVTEWTYDEASNVTGIIDPRQNVTQFRFDQNNNLELVIDALNGEVALTYDPEDMLLSVTDQNGHTRRITYDEENNTTSLQLPLGQTTVFGYDKRNNRISITNAKGNKTTFSFDELDLLSSTTNPLDFTTYVEYDPLRRVKRVVDAENNETLYTNDLLGRLVAVQDALTHQTDYEFDEIGSLVLHRDANEHDTEFEVDLLGRTVKETNAEGDTWSYVWDEVGNLIERVDANGAKTTFVWDPDNRLTRIEYPSGPPVEFGYDANANLTIVTDGTGGELFEYDALNRLVKSVRTDGILAGKVIEYSYDAVGNRTSVIYPDGRKAVSYNYNANDWLVEVFDPMNEGPTTYQHDDVGLPVNISYPNQTWSDYVYDPADRLVNIFNGKQEGSTDLISSFAFELDKVGNRLQSVERLTRGQVITWTKEYEYDPVYRLTSATETPDRRPYQTLVSQYSYDPVGNRLSQLTNIAEKPDTPSLPAPVQTEYSYDRANRMLTAGSLSMQYDRNGCRIRQIGEDRAIEYDYDFENRLVGATTYDVQPNGRHQADAQLHFAVDGLGRRRERGVSERGVTKLEQFLYDAHGYDMLAEYTEPSHPITTFYYRDMAQILSRHEIQGRGQGLQYFNHHDALGSVSAWTNQAGREVHEYRYAPYGRLIDNNGPDNANNMTEPHTPLTFSGKPWDKELELNHFGAREYDPTVGVWTSPDPYRGRISSPITVVNRYHYTANNPTNWIDPYGFDMGPKHVLSNGNAKNFYITLLKYYLAQSVKMQLDNYRSDIMTGISSFGSALVGSTLLGTIVNNSGLSSSVDKDWYSLELENTPWAKIEYHQKFNIRTHRNRFFNLDFQGTHILKQTTSVGIGPLEVSSSFHSGLGITLQTGSEQNTRIRGFNINPHLIDIDQSGRVKPKLPSFSFVTGTATTEDHGNGLYTTVSNIEELEVTPRESSYIAAGAAVVAAKGAVVIAGTSAIADTVAAGTTAIVNFAPRIPQPAWNLNRF